jgi:hypothetical protein
MASRSDLFVVVGCPLSIFLSTPDLLALSSTCRACRALPRVADWGFKYRQRWGGPVCAASRERFSERLLIRRHVGRALSSLRTACRHRTTPDQEPSAMPAAASDPPFSQARRDLLGSIEQRMARCRFSEEWVDYLVDYPDVHLVDCAPLAIDEDEIDFVAVMGLGPADDPTDPWNDPDRHLHRYLPLSLGAWGVGVSLCYYDLESNEMPAYLLQDHCSTTAFGMCDQWIEDTIHDDCHRIASHVDMLDAFIHHVYN